MLAFFLLLCGVDVMAQTIGDYSRSQRAVIEAEIVKNNVRVLGASLPASSPQPLPPPPPLPPLPSGPGLAGAGATPPLEPEDVPGPGHGHERRSSAGKGPQWAVTGVFVSAAKVVAEVVVDGRPYFLAVGEQVPGTRWRVDSIAVDRVVMAGESGKGSSVPRRRVSLLAEGALR